MSTPVRLARYLIRLALALTCTAVLAQAPAQGDPWLRALSGTRNFQLGRPARPAFTPDGQTILFLRSGPRDPRQSLHAFDLVSGETREILSAAQLLGGPGEELSAEEKARRERQRITAAGLVSFELSRDGTHLLVPLSGRLHWVDWRNNRSTPLRVTAPVTDAKLSPDGRKVAWVRNHDLWACSLPAGREAQVTRGGSSSLTHGEAEFVAQEEMARTTGYWWSPDSKQILYAEADHKAVEVWQVGDPFQPGTAPTPQFYPRPGKTNVSIRLGIVGVNGGRTKWIQWDRSLYPYLARAQWHETGGLTITVQTRDQREMVVLKVDPASGRTTTLLVEKDAAWVNLDHSSPRWIEGGRRFLWTSERSGRWELEIRLADGALDRVLVPGRFGWQGFLALDEATRRVWFIASQDPTQQHVWSVDLDGSPPVRITDEPGHHTAVIAESSGACVITSATPAGMPRSRVFRSDGSRIGELPSVAEEPDRPIHADFQKVGEGEGWHAKIVRPSRFEPGRMYPVIVSVYGGPHVQVVKQTLASSLTDQWLADQGFIVVAMDGRGTPGRGRDWERAIYGRLGPVPLEEQVSALRALAARNPEMDLERVGITGWSFGGYLSAYAVLRRPDAFRAAVAGAPVTDWEDYDTHYTERYMGVPSTESTRAAYRESSCLTWAANLSRPLLLLHGTRDDNVFFRHTLRLTDALIRAGRPVDVLPLPGFTHMVPDPVVAEQRWQRTAEYFRRHLTMKP